MRLSISLVCLFLVFGCGSSTAVSTSAPEIRIEQLPGSEFVVQQRGAISIAYQLTVRNRSTEAIILRQLEMKTVGKSPYVLRNTPATFDESIEQGAEKMVTFSMWAYPRESESKQTATVWVEGTAHFESAKGRFQTNFSQSFRQPAGE